MKHHLVGILAAAMLLSIAGIAQAQDERRVAVELGYLGISVPSESEGGIRIPSARLGALVGRVGYDVFPWLAVEGALGLGVQDDDVRLLGYKFKVSVEHVALAAVKLQQRGDNFSIHARLGFHRTKGAVKSGNDKETDSGSEFIYGVGAAGRIAGNTWVRGDWTRDAEDTDMYSLTLVQRF